METRGFGKIEFPHSHQRDPAMTATPPIARGAAEFHGIRYLVTDVKRAADFYELLGFEVVQQHLPEFATLSQGGLNILLTGPGASGCRPLSSGEKQLPGGSNRVVMRVKNLAAIMEGLRAAGVKFRTEPEKGFFGTQLQVLDPDGNPIELNEPAQRS
jgi:glyoxylase I family protein